MAPSEFWLLCNVVSITVKWNITRDKNEVILVILSCSRNFFIFLNWNEENWIALNLINYLQNSNFYIIQVSKPWNFKIGLTSVLCSKKTEVPKSLQIYTCSILTVKNISPPYFKDISAMNSMLNRAFYFFFLFFPITFLLVWFI